MHPCQEACETKVDLTGDQGRQLQDRSCQRKLAAGLAPSRRRRDTPSLMPRELGCKRARAGADRETQSNKSARLMLRAQEAAAAHKGEGPTRAAGAAPGSAERGPGSGAAAARAVEQSRCRARGRSGAAARVADTDEGERGSGRCGERGGRLGRERPRAVSPRRGPGAPVSAARRPREGSGAQPGAGCGRTRAPSSAVRSARDAASRRGQGAAPRRCCTDRGGTGRAARNPAASRCPPPRSPRAGCQDQGELRVAGPTSAPGSAALRYRRAARVPPGRSPRPAARSWSPTRESCGCCGAGSEQRGTGSVPPARPDGTDRELNREQVPPPRPVAVPLSWPPQHPRLRSWRAREPAVPPAATTGAAGRARTGAR